MITHRFHIDADGPWRVVESENKGKKKKGEEKIPVEGYLRMTDGGCAL